MKLTRRKLLATSAATLAAPLFIPASALGQGKRPAPSNRIVIGGIGLGNQGSGDQGNFLGRDDIQYVACCDVRKEFLDKAVNTVNNRYNNKDCLATKDFRELLARKDIDAVHIATPDHWHAVITIAACKAGKDVFCQKPESLTIKEGRAMVNAARQFGRVVSGGSQRVLEDYTNIVRKVWDGNAGKPTDVFVDCGMPSKYGNLKGENVPDGIDWDFWLGPAPYSPYHPSRISGSFNIDGSSWRSYKDYSGGHMTDWGAHHFGGMLFAIDKMETGPAEIIPPSDSKLDLKGSRDPELLQKKYLTMKFEGAVRMYHAPDIQHDVICAGPAVAPKKIPKYKGKGSIHGDFIHCITTREKPFRDIERAHRTATVCHLANICYELGRKLQWNAESETFVNDESANRLLDRARRQPWSI